MVRSARRLKKPTKSNCFPTVINCIQRSFFHFSNQKEILYLSRNSKIKELFILLHILMLKSIYHSCPYPNLHPEVQTVQSSHLLGNPRLFTHLMYSVQEKNRLNNCTSTLQNKWPRTYYPTMLSSQ